MPSCDPDQPSRQRDEHRFHEELAQNVAAPRPDGPPQADLARALRHRDQHDVHDADAAHDEGDGRDRGEEQAQTWEAASWLARISDKFRKAKSSSWFAWRW